MAILQGECPKCGKRVLHVNVEHIVGLVDGSSKARCLSSVSYTHLDVYKRQALGLSDFF